MSFESAGYPLLPVLPELVLAAGAMVLLMLGAYRGQQTTSLVTGLAICLLVLTGGLELLLPAGKLTTFAGGFIVDPSGAVDPDRVLIITEWTNLTREQLLTIISADDPSAAEHAAAQPR